MPPPVVGGRGAFGRPATYAPPGAFAALPPPTIPVATTRPVVAVFGDSLTVQAWDYVAQISKARGWAVTGAAMGGTAPCDHVGRIRSTLAAARPTVVVLAFVGNAATKCIQRADRTSLPVPQVAARYRADLLRIVDLVRRAGAQAWIVRPPRTGNPGYAAVRAALVPVLDAVAAAAPATVRLLDAAPWLSPDGYAAALPCAPYETPALGCRNGRIKVRFGDGLHLVPTFGTSAYSAGAWRYAEALVGQLPRA